MENYQSQPKPKAKKKVRKNNWQQAKRDSKIILKTIFICTVVVVIANLYVQNQDLQQQLDDRSGAIELEAACEYVNPTVLAPDEDLSK